MATLNIIGAGRLGKTLGRLWHEQSLFRIQALCNRSLDSAASAQIFIGAGQAYSWAQRTLLPPADYWLLACSDDQLAACCQALADAQYFTAQTTVFHCSGALSAYEVLHSAQQQGAAIASLHPIKSFAEPSLVLTSFTETYCGVEGDASALAQLVPLFTALGARCFTIPSGAKTLYHAASVIACNYLVALQELALQTYQQAGVERSQAVAILRPIVTHTVQAIFQLDTVQALTGPIARGDLGVVRRQQQALQAWNPHYAALYQGLGQLALQLAQQKETLNAAQYQALRDILDT